jgi:hypothetical protein
MHSILEKLTSEDTVSWEPITETPLVVCSGSESSSSEDESLEDLNGGKGEGTAEPHRDDVLLGRGKKHHTHPGNALFASTL